MFPPVLVYIYFQQSQIRYLYRFEIYKIEQNVATTKIYSYQFGECNPIISDLFAIDKLLKKYSIL